MWVKFHFKTMQGHAHLTDAESAALIGADRESHQRDLFESIERGDYPKWRFCVQTMTEEQAEKAAFNPFDLTKVWPQGDYPLVEVGVLELNRNPENYFAEVEQSGFSPANVVPGIGHSPDKMLQFRIFSYADAHRYRLGVNHDALPVNRPRCAVNGYHRDGTMRFDDNGGGAVNYEPNSFGGPVEDPSYKEPPLPITGAGRPLRPPRRQRRLHATGQFVPAAGFRPARAPVRQHRARDGGRGGRDCATAIGTFPQSGSGLRRGRGQGLGRGDEKGGVKAVANRFLIRPFTLSGVAAFFCAATRFFLR